MSEAVTYSPRLGPITDAQFQAVAERLNLGRFLKAEPTISGLFGQNVFVTTTEGEFVLRGAPHWVKRPLETTYWRQDRHQFTKERYFAQQLHERAGVPTPWPMLHDETDDIFGWPYLVMPKMPGQCFNERSIRKALPPDDRRGVAVALGAMLAQMQDLTSPFAGSFDVETIELAPYPGGATQHVIDETRGAVAAAEANGVMRPQDIAWVEAASERALAAGERPNTYVHSDYKLDNMTVSKADDGWHVTGLFDLHGSRFGDGALDIARQACSYLDTEPELAGEFVRSYLNRAAPDPRLAALAPLYVIGERVLLWEFLNRPEMTNWLKGQTFKEWTERYIDAIVALL